MRIGTWNVCGFRGYSGTGARPDLSSVEDWVRVLARLDCDVLALQEVGLDQNWLGRVAARLGLQASFLSSPVRWPAAILSRLPIRDRGGLLLDDLVNVEPSEEGPFSRSAGTALIELGARADLWVVSLHAHPHDATMREREAEVLSDRLREMDVRDEFVAVVGDFNCEPPESFHRRLHELGFQNAFVSGRTPRTRLQDRDQVAIDHIYLSSSLRPALLGEARAVAQTGFAPRGGEGWAYSDHLPVVVDLDRGACRARCGLSRGPI
ncbi:MAG: endonuclease/exonuclease/phosphatase family protein [Deltaproteobacteria bacterium]|jgi:endonuclease/exonuclease/phosphatase family metal-dependent hydrolase|nr:endonuclease/exonuclease/phosphatase family protein [Deltaproteobacteria bacterium]